MTTTKKILAMSSHRRKLQSDVFLGPLLQAVLDSNVSMYADDTSLCYQSLDINKLKPRPNALDFSLYIARQMSSIVECCRERVAKRSRLFTRLGTQHSIDVLLE